MRYDILERTNLEEGVQFYDLSSVDWGKFKFNKVIDYTLDISDVTKPWLISYKFYRNLDYEDILFLINGIENPLELSIGQVIKIPPIQDIENFLREYA